VSKSGLGIDRELFGNQPLPHAIFTFEASLQPPKDGPLRPLQHTTLHRAHIMCCRPLSHPRQAFVRHTTLKLLAGRQRSRGLLLRRNMFYLHIDSSGGKLPATRLWCGYTGIRWRSIGHGRIDRAPATGVEVTSALGLQHHMEA
jgi:hypothetical protein